jgi:hypothetical protein
MMRRSSERGSRKIWSSITTRADALAYDSTMAGFTRLFIQPETADMRREIVPGTLEVHPLGDFGLLEICQHRFCHTENGSEECGTFKNIMVWRKEGAGYKVSRVISYGH